MPSKTVRAQSTASTSAVSRIGQRRQVVIPKHVFDALALKAGDYVEVTAENGRVAMKPKRASDAGATLTAAEARKVRHAMQQAKAGKTRPWSQVKHDLGL